MGGTRAYGMSSRTLILFGRETPSWYCFSLDTYELSATVDLVRSFLEKNGLKQAPVTCLGLPSLIFQAIISLYLKQYFNIIKHINSCLKTLFFEEIFFFFKPWPQPPPKGTCDIPRNTAPLTGPADCLGRLLSSGGGGSFCKYLSQNSVPDTTVWLWKDATQKSNNARKRTRTSIPNSTASKLSIRRPASSVEPPTTRL